MVLYTEKQIERCYRDYSKEEEPHETWIEGYRKWKATQK